MAAQVILNVENENWRMMERESKVIGYFAYASPTAVVCSGAACVIAGSEEAMREYVRELCPSTTEKHTVGKTRFGEIMRGLALGAAYAFDRESYARFRPLGRQEGLDLAEADFAKHAERFFTVQIHRR